MSRHPVNALAVLGGLLVGLFVVEGCDLQDESVPQLEGEDSTYVSSAGIRFRRIPAGSFQMGSADGQEDERPVHDVEITEPFYISVSEVTQVQWRSLMDRNPSHFRRAYRPVDSVSWHRARVFIQRLNEKEETDLYRLPTEAEWEYAVRGRSSTRFHFGEARDSLAEHAWYSYNSEQRTHRPCRKQRNPFDLCDMHGNVWEWVHDGYDPTFYEHSDREDPVNTGALSDPRVIRGGGWYSVAPDMRSANRAWARPGAQDSQLGFRVVREIPDEEQ